MSATDTGTVGFVGLGEQGAPLAHNLRAAGYRLHVFDVRPAAVEGLVAAGCVAAASPAAAGSAAPTVLVCVGNDEQLAAAALGPDGVLAGMAPGGLLIINSTVSPVIIAELGRRCAAAGIDLVDAPLTGGAGGAHDRSLVYFVGGEAAAVERARPFLEVSARKLIMAGGPGDGIRAKLVHQLILCGNLLAARDGWRLGEASGLGPDIIGAVIRDGAAQSRIAERYPSLRWGGHVAGLFAKDLGLCLDAGAALGLDLKAAGFAHDNIGCIAGDD
jgi:2-hydroxy-3-oxopropionate reductase